MIGKGLRRELLPLVLLFLFLVVYSLLFSSLPEKIPTHFGSDGTPNGWTSKILFPFLVLAMGLFLHFLLTRLPSIDPKGESLLDRYSLFLTIRNSLLLFLFAFSLMSLWIAETGRSPRWLVGGMVALLFIFLGNLLPRVPANWFVGIRTPWTLSSERIWKTSHRVGGILFVITGLGILLLSLLGLNSGTAMFVLIVPMVLFVAFIYPFSLFLREKRVHKEKP